MVGKKADVLRAGVVGIRRYVVVHVIVVALASFV